jgi:hypothetical protein
MAEFGTGCGVGTAWLRSGVRPGTQILSAELDPELATAAQEIFVDDPQVEVLAADWSTLLDKGPFSLLFLDSGQPGEVGVDAVADLVEVGRGDAVGARHDLVGGHPAEGLVDRVVLAADGPTREHLVVRRTGHLVIPVEDVGHGGESRDLVVSCV